MAASVTLRGEMFSLARILRGLSRLTPRALSACSHHKICNTTRSHFLITPRSSFHTGAVLSSTPSPFTVTDMPDALFQKVSLLVKGHDRAVLDSYEFFITMTAKELGITISNISEPPKNMERFTLLKSVHIFKKHRVQYEMRTHYRCIEISHITGCTAQLYLEYVQRNLPEGVAMAVTKTTMEKVPDHILEPMWKDDPADSKPSQ